MMASKHGLSKNDVKHLRKFNEKVFKERDDLAQNLSHKDLENPSLRHTISESGLGKQFSEYQMKEIMDSAHKNQFK